MQIIHTGPPRPGAVDGYRRNTESQQGTCSWPPAADPVVGFAVAAGSRHGGPTVAPAAN